MYKIPPGGGGGSIASSRPIKLISLKRKKEISIYTLNVFNQYISCEYSKVPSQLDGSFEHPRYKTMVVNRASTIL